MCCTDLLELMYCTCNLLHAGAAGGKSATSSSPAGGAGAESKPGAVVVYLASALVAFVSVLA